MVFRYYLVYSILPLLLVAFIPAMIAANKEKRFTKWYAYSVLLFPAAMIHSLFVKKPVHYVNIFIHNKQNPSKIVKKTYRSVPVEKREIVIRPGHLYVVFFSKLLFGGFVGIVLFTIFRLFVYDTKTLRASCALFALLFTILLSIVQLCRFSRFPLIADEITKRALVFIGISLCCSLPLILLRLFVLDNIFPEKYIPVNMFLCTIFSFALFVFFLLKKQRFYYSVFNRFFDYSVISMASYAIFAALSLCWLSIYNLQKYIYLFAMPMQIFNLEYLNGAHYIKKLPYIYSSALVHLFIECILFLSGILCRNFKKKEFLYRVEYRTKAFNMTRKAVLKRRIPVHSAASPISHTN